MNNRNLIILSLTFFAYLIVQILLFKGLVLFDLAFCFVYVGFLLILPFDIDRLLLMFIGLITGLCVDVFYDTLGIHAASCVLIMYLRTHVLKTGCPPGGV